MLRRAWIILGEITVALVIVAAAILLWASWYVDTDEFKDNFVKVAEQLTGMPVLLRGELNVAVYPGVSLEVLDLAVLGDEKFGSEPLMEFDTLRVSARLLPLLSKRFELHSILVEGMRINILKSPDGELNWQSVLDRQSRLASLPESGGESASDITLSDLEVVNASIAYRDMADNQTISLQGIAIRTGAIEAGRDIPFSATSMLTWKLPGINARFVLKGIIEPGGDGKGFQLRDGNLYASVGGAFLPKGASPGELLANVDLDWEKKRLAFENVTLRLLGLQGEGEIRSGNLNEGVHFDGRLHIKPFSPSFLARRFFPNISSEALKGLGTGEFSTVFSVDQSGLALQETTVSVGETVLTGELRMQDYAKPVFTFDAKGNRVDLELFQSFSASNAPLVWGDIPLDALAVFRGSGSLRLGHLKFRGKAFENVSLKVGARDEGLSFELEAGTAKGDTFMAQSDFLVDRKKGSRIPTLGGTLRLRASTAEQGVPFLSFSSLSTTGPGKFDGDFSFASVPCTPAGLVRDILAYVKTDATLSLGPGNGTFRQEKVTHSLRYAGLEGSFKFVPRKQELGGVLNYDADISLRGNGEGRVDSFSLSAQGPLAFAMESGHAASSGLQCKGGAAGTLSGKPSRVSANGLISFDTARRSVAARNVRAKVLESSVGGEVQLSDWKSLKGTGRLDVPGANVRRMIYLLTDVRLRTMDVNALGKVRLSTDFSFDDKQFRLANLNGDVDGTPFEGVVDGKGYMYPKLSFTLKAGKFDLDRYLPPSTGPTPEEKRAGKVHKAPPVDLPLVFLRALDLSGDARFEEFKLASMRTRNLTGHIEAEKGKIYISRLHGDFYEGILTGEWTGLIRARDLITRLQLHAKNAQAGPLMRDLAEREYLRGRTNLDFDLTSKGGTDDDIVRNLSGKARGMINDGSYKFSGYRDVPADPQQKDTVLVGGTPSRANQRTSFKRAEASCAVNQGIFEVEALSLEAPPILQSTGKGWFNLPDDSIDLSIRNDFVAVPSVTVRISGRLSDPEINIPKGKIVNDTVRNILNLPEKSFKFLRDLFN
ncbi:AsmA family protein [Pseudodesulfovibrio cashew]|uniref:AsmA family protein n=1 Tax=Pseudodesulfovibrio cashew TaxID=2678688 RepID=A0A6I6JFV3_9BACT|nr:AsmA family protein [Pseudodesulfovibrio cashew]QGY41051.1 AsmA family protein [Pseudodesulfovibrio cashew]